MQRNRVLRTLALVGVACLITLATACTDSGSLEVTLLLDADCRDGGDIYLDDGSHWYLDHNSNAPISWRGREEVSGTLTTTATDHGYFVADDGTRLAVTNSFRKMSCSVWE